MTARLHAVLATTRRRSMVVLAFALLLPASAAAQQHFASTRDLELMLRYLVEDGETPGIVLGMIEADGSTRIVSYGNAGRDALPLGPKSVFEIGSITKVFTGTLLADMVERGEVSLSDPVAKYLPAEVKMPARNGREITLLDLAMHRSALPRMPSNMPQDPANPYPDYTIDDLYAFLTQHQLRRDIGAEYEYSNIGVALLGHVLARAAGRDYETLLRERVLEPLGLHMTSTVVEGELQRWLTKGHDGEGNLAPPRKWPQLPGMGGIRSNAEDMLVFLAANIGPPESRLERVMRTAHEVRSSVNPQTDIGLNWQVRKIGNRRLIMHGGATAGYITQIAFDPDKRVGFVMLTNSGEFGDDIGLDFLRRGPPLAIPEVEVSRDVLARYVGQYEVAPGRFFVVRMESDGSLTMQAPGNVRFRMYAESETKFFVKRTPWRFTFTKNEAGEVVGMDADLEGTARTGRKVAGEPPPPAVVAGNAALDLPVRAEDIARYEGTYTLTSGSNTLELRVFVAPSGQLMAQPSGQNASRLLRQGNHEFAPAAAPDIRIVFVLENGRAVSLTLRQGGTVYQGTRKTSG